jgi:hypothetical protein
MYFMNSKRNFKWMLFLLLPLAAILALCGLWTRERILFVLAAATGLGALIQYVLFVMNPGLFKDKEHSS